jgi:multiple sugar transport system permease protein
MTDIKILTAKPRSQKRNKLILDAVCYLLLTVVAVVILIPFFFILSTSFKSLTESVAQPFKWIPQTWIFSNYTTVLKRSEFMALTLIEGLVNTLRVTAVPVVAGLFTSAMAAFAFSKIKFPGRTLLFGLVLSTMMIPGTVTLTPSYIIYDNIGWVNTYLPLFIPGLFGNIGCIFFLRQFIMTLPNDLCEAAKIDGMSQGGIFLKIILPLCKPALITQLVLMFVGGYNDFFGPFLYLNNEKLFTLQLVLRSFEGTYFTNWPIVMAASVIAILPLLALFLFIQRFLIEGISLSGMKL